MTIFLRSLKGLGGGGDDSLLWQTPQVATANVPFMQAQKGYTDFLTELQRCEKLGLTMYNFHPGSTTGDWRIILCCITHDCSLTWTACLYKLLWHMRNAILHRQINDEGRFLLEILMSEKKHAVGVPRLKAAQVGGLILCFMQAFALTRSQWTELPNS